MARLNDGHLPTRATEIDTRSAFDGTRTFGDAAPRHLFDVTVARVVGSVYENPNDPHTPRDAAFLLISGECCDGVFQFPTQDGETVTVTVATSRVEQVAG